MHPSVRADQPGKCPICSMDLTPVTRQEVESGVILVDAQRRQTIGVRTAPVVVEPIETTIRAVGAVTADETRLSAVTLKNRGWIGELHVDQTGQEVRRGQPLFTLYSPELLAAQEELLTVLASQRRARETSAPERSDYLVEAAKRRLRLWDLTDHQIERIAASGEPIEYLPVPSPVSGYVVEKNVVAGAAVEPGQTLFRVAGLDRVWVEAQVYESELPLVEVGQRAEVTLPYLPGERFAGEVTFVSPVLSPGTRTGTVRVELPNPKLALKPEMYANVVLRVEGAERLVVPTEAVIYAGPRRLVFVDLGEGRLQPREVEIGRQVGDRYEVLSGLAPGEVVVVSGNFLIAAESRLKSATEQW
jgi:Cu(I)/Ag(I) efflux system membrane fusion protein